MLENWRMEHKIVTTIHCPYLLEAKNDYGSHKPLIYLILNKDIECHPFAEFGSGESTFVFRDFCNANGRKFESYETDVEWSSYNGSKQINDYKDIHLLDGYILFIDSKPGEQRKDLIKWNKDKYILIVHDTEPYAQRVYDIEDILSKFKYRVDFTPEYLPHTTALSNTVNICEWV